MSETSTTPPLVIDSSSRQEVGMDRAQRHHSINQLDLIDIHGVHRPPPGEYIFLSDAHEAFVKADLILGQ